MAGVVLLICGFYCKSYFESINRTPRLAAFLGPTGVRKPGKPLYRRACRGRFKMFWLAAVFTLAAPVAIGLLFQDTATAWIAAFCGAFITLAARFDALAELSFGPLKAKMKEAIAEANTTITELREVASTLARTSPTDLMAGEFMDGISLSKRLDLYDSTMAALGKIGVSPNGQQNEMSQKKPEALITREAPIREIVWSLMSNRKGKLTTAGIDRDWPHQVALPARECAGEHGKRHREFCDTLTLAPRHHTVRKEDTDYLVYCFTDQAQADQFRERFGGEKFNPRDRGRGHSWHRWRKS